MSEIPSPVRCGRHLFTIRDGGRLTCFAADSGRVLYEERVGAGGQYLASPVAIALPGGRTLLVLYSVRGVVTLAWAQDRLALAGSLDPGETIKATPALDGRRDRMYLRTARALHAFATRP